MAGNLDATYPTKTEFKDVPVDPSAASKASVGTKLERRNSVLVEDKTLLMTILPSAILRAFLCLHLAAARGVTAVSAEQRQKSLTFRLPRRGDWVSWWQRQLCNNVRVRVKDHQDLNQVFRQGWV